MGKELRFNPDIHEEISSLQTVNLYMGKKSQYEEGGCCHADDNDKI